MNHQVVAGKILRGDDVREFTPALGAFYSSEHSLFLNNIGQRAIEYWHLMDITALAGAIIRLALSRDAAVLAMWENSVNRIIRMARQIGHDFNAQGYRFDKGIPYTGDPMFRQPDATLFQARFRDRTGARARGRHDKPSRHNA